MRKGNFKFTMRLEMRMSPESDVTEAPRGRELTFKNLEKTVMSGGKLVVQSLVRCLLWDTENVKPSNCKASRDLKIGDGLGVRIAWARQMADVEGVYALSLVAVLLGLLGEWGVRTAIRGVGRRWIKPLGFRP